MKKKVLLDVMRQWDKNLPDIEYFWIEWLEHENDEERLGVYDELRWWCNYCDCKDIETIMELVCELWDKIQKYEKEHPEKDKFKDLEEADVEFEVMWDFLCK